MSEAEKELNREVDELREFAGTMIHVLAGRSEFRHMRDCAIECCVMFDRAKKAVEIERERGQPIDVGRN